MQCDLNAYRVTIGRFNQNKKFEKMRIKKQNKSGKSVGKPITIPLFIMVFYNSLIRQTDVENIITTATPLTLHTRAVKLICMLLLFCDLLCMCGDIHPNPGPITTQCENLTVYLLNAQSLKANSKNKSKINEFRHMINILEPDIIAISETWLIDGIPNSEFADEKVYSVYRKDRTEDIRGGGALLMIKKTLWSRDRKEWLSVDPHNNEITAAELRPTTNRSIGVISAYRSQTNPCPEFLSNLDTIISNAIQNNVVEFLVLGDLNYSTIKWDPAIDTHLPKHSKELINYLQQHNLQQLNKHPSRKGEENILDLIITNITDAPSEVTCGRYSYTSDHYLFDVEFKMNISRSIQIPRKVLNFKRARFDRLRHDIVRDTNDILLQNHMPNELWGKLKDTIISATHRHIPSVNIKNKLNPAWIDAEVVRTSHLKQCAFNKSKRTKKPEDVNKYRKLRNDIKTLVARKYKEYIHNLTENLGSNPKRFWTLLKDRCKTKSSPDIITHNNTDITDPTAKSSAFNTYFQSVFSNRTHQHQTFCMPTKILF